MLQAIETRYFGPTNFRGARIKATSGSGKTSVTVPWYHKLDAEENHFQAARHLAFGMNWLGRYDLVQGSLKDSYVFVLVPKKKAGNSSPPEDCL